MTKAYIFSHDPIMHSIEVMYGKLPEVKVTSDVFLDLTSTIVGQQLSTKAAGTIWGRFELLFENKKVTPEAIQSLPELTMREAGLSFQKIKYMKGLAELMINKEIDLAALQYMKDSDVITELTKIKGIGVWSAEMTLMFSLARPDIFSMGDLGLRTAVSRLYGVDRNDLEAIAKISEKWAPFRTTASRYLWKSLDNEPTRPL